MHVYMVDDRVLYTPVEVASSACCMYECDIVWNYVNYMAEYSHALEQHGKSIDG